MTTICSPELLEVDAKEGFQIPASDGSGGEVRLVTGQPY